MCVCTLVYAKEYGRIHAHTRTRSFSHVRPFFCAAGNKKMDFRLAYFSHCHTLRRGFLGILIREGKEDKLQHGFRASSSSQADLAIELSIEE